MPSSPSLSRRNFLNLFGLGAASTLAGCATYSTVPRYVPSYPIAPTRLPWMDGPVSGSGVSTAELDVMYGPREDNGYLIPAVPYDQIPPQYYRQRVSNPTGEPSGTVVVDTAARYLYLVEPGGTAMRYGVGIGREGFAWQGEGVIQWRKKWPRWNPPDEMVARKPELVKYSIANGGMDPGLDNPLGARALYIFQNGQDTLYRLHGSPEWQSIGKAVSSGCVRLLNQDVIDLYDRVPNKARIVVWQ
ncbi:L,D-transpeptidase [Rhizobiaceae bacterium n13]|uniref:L,D-transpeptidase n=1 Tax=Ferirhizobium litorale TaxID=2927786 RepID=A0AAE3TZY0_9HYPH|nr:L,D-transpeptidase [Fererhizobium litorale]MDI7861342.1 L,D-transpeptidase [Fererhizobium litorale]MDI7921489.1 L,D-transpeptidase [Fererhizobium litorale]